MGQLISSEAKEVSRIADGQLTGLYKSTVCTTPIHIKPSPQPAQPAPTAPTAPTAPGNSGSTTGNGETNGETNGSAEVVIIPTELLGGGDADGNGQKDSRCLPSIGFKYKPRRGDVYSTLAGAGVPQDPIDFSLFLPLDRSPEHFYQEGEIPAARTQEQIIDRLNDPRNFPLFGGTGINSYDDVRTAFYLADNQGFSAFENISKETLAKVEVPEGYCPGIHPCFQSDLCRGCPAIEPIGSITNPVVPVGPEPEPEPESWFTGFVKRNRSILVITVIILIAILVALLVWYFMRKRRGGSSKWT